MAEHVEGQPETIEGFEPLTVDSVKVGQVVADKASFLARCSKALAGGITGAVTAGGTAVGTALADGAIDGGDGWLIAGAIVGGFAIGFAGVWAAPANKD